MPLYLYFVILSFLASILVYNKPGMPAFLRLFPWFLGITIIVEILSLRLWNKGNNTYQLYDAFTVFEFCFYLFVLSRIIHAARTARMIVYTIPVYVVLAVLNILFYQKHSFHSITYSLGCLLVVSFSVYYFFELFQSQKSIRLSREPSFWICSGLLFYYCCSFPFLGLTSLISTMPKILLDNVASVLVAINIILYSSFTIAFLCQIQIRKSMLRS